MEKKRLFGFRRDDPVILAPTVYPVAAALLSVIGLAAENPGSGITLRALGLPLALSVGVAAIAWLGSRMVTADPHRRGAFALIVVLGALYLGYLEGGMSWLLEAMPGGPSAIVFPVLLAVLVLSVVLVLRTNRDLAPVTRFLNVTMVVLLVVMGVQVVRGVDFGGTDSTPGAAHQHIPAADPSRDDPDIYFIVLDAYSGASSLERHYGLDIGDFIAELEALGFVVPRESRANYVSTILSLASMLNWNYLDDDVLAPGGALDDRSEVHRLMHDNATTRFLRQRGYRVVFLRSSFPPLNGSPIADEQWPEVLAGEFEHVWIENTALVSLVRMVCQAITCGDETLAFWADAAEAHLARFGFLADFVPSESQPTFVYAHILLPHEPFLFASDCTPLEPFLPQMVDESNEAKTMRRYRMQVECVNQLVSDLVRELVSKEDRPPVVILQSDHGYGRIGLRLPPLGETDTAKVEERLDVFAAYYLPHGGGDAIYDGISPINALRLVFAHTFDFSLPLLEDRSYWSYWRRHLQPEPVPR